jgi:hypothetical protein
MPFLGVKLTEQDQKILEERAMSSGKTLSDCIRDLIRNDQEKKLLSELLQEIKNHHSREIAALREEFKSIKAGLNAPGGGNEQTRELQEIKRILTVLDKRTAEQHRTIMLLGQASPFVSRQLGRQ